MAESFLALTIFLIVVALLIYFYLREFKHAGRQDIAMGLHVTSIDHQLDRIEKIVQSRDNLLKDILDKKDHVHMRHIQALEKQLKPNPVMDFVAQETPKPEAPNDIEKTESELEADEFNKAFANIPITADTKVVIEGDQSQLPEEIL